MTFSQKNMGRLLTSAVLIALAVAILFPGCRRSAESDAELEDVRLARVTIHQVHAAQGYESAIHYTGEVVPRQSSMVAFQHSGRVTDVLVDEGERVEKDQTLATLDKRHLLATEKRLNAELSQAKHLLTEMQNGPREQTIAAARADMENIDQQLNRATRDLARNEELVESNSISTRAFEESKFEVTALEAQLESAKQKLKELELGTREETKQAQQSRIDAIEASLESLQFDLDDCELKAPYAGLVVKRMLDDGAMADPQQPVFLLIEDKKLEIHVGLPGSIVSKLEVGDVVAASTDVGSGKLRVHQVINEIDRMTQTSKVILTLLSDQDKPILGNGEQLGSKHVVSKTTAAKKTDNEYVELKDEEESRRVEELKLVPGQTVRISFSKQNDVSGFWLPTSSLIGDHHGLWTCFVAAIDDASASGTSSGGQVATLSRESVEVIHRENERAYVRGTLSDGQWIVGDGVHRLVDEQEVVVEGVSGQHQE